MASEQSTTTARPDEKAAPRVLVVAPEPISEDRGTPIAVRQVLEALVELGFAVDLLTYPVGPLTHLEGVRVFRCRNPFGVASVPIGFSFRKILLDLFLTASLYRLLRRLDYACVHAVEEAVFAAIPLASGRGVPVIYDMQSSIPEQLAERWAFRGRPAQALLRRCERWALRRASHVVSSTGLAVRVGTLAPGTERSEWRFPPDVARAAESEVQGLREELEIPPSAPVVVYSGNFEPYQGVSLLLRAVPLVREARPEAIFVLVGARDRREARRILDSVAAIPDRAVRIVERRPREAMGAYYGLSAVLVSPRIAGSNLPLKVLDYLAVGGAIVATDIPAHRSILADDRALLVPPSPEGLADGILRVLDDPALRGSLERGAEGYAREHLGWDTFVEGIRRVYARVLRDDRSRTPPPHAGQRREEAVALAPSRGSDRTLSDRPDA